MASRTLVVHFGLSVATVHFSELQEISAFIEALDDDLAKVTHYELFSLYNVKIRNF